MGPSDAPTITSPQMVFFLNPSVSMTFDLRLMALVKESFSHNFGKRETKPKINMIPPESHFQKSCGTSINNVLAFNKRVKRMIDRQRDTTTIKSLLLLNVESERDLPTMTGKSGSMHGASTVKIPATNEIISRVILFYFRYQ